MADFSRTRKALQEYDLEIPIIEGLFTKANTSALRRTALAVKAVSVAKVRAAFLQDTKDTNTKDRAYQIHPDDPWFRSLVTKEDNSCAL